MLKTHGLMATKVGMTQIFLKDGVCVPVTVLHLEDNLVLKKRTSTIDGYDAVLLGYGEAMDKRLSKPKLGFFKKLGLPSKKRICEFRVNEAEIAGYEEGKSADTSWIKEDCSLDVSGISKGKGFAGVMKRYNFGGAPASHGAHETFRGGGSIGNREDPGKVFKGKKMAGHMGSERITVKNVRVIRFLESERIICVRGGLPGAKGDVLEIRLSSRKPKAIRGLAGPKEDKALKNPMKASKAGAGAKSKDTKKK